MFVGQILLMVTSLLFTLQFTSNLAWASEPFDFWYWPSSGQNQHNTRHAPFEFRINPDNVENLAVKWIFETSGDVSATPAVDHNAVYVPDWGGHLYKINRHTGGLIWSHLISDYNDVQSSFARTTPALYKDSLIFGDQGGRLGAGATVMAVDRQTGDLIWRTKVEEHPFAVVTQSAVVHAGRIYVGVASIEELAAVSIPGYPCCSFRGSVVALDAQSGTILWKTYMAPLFPGDEASTLAFSGNSVWGNTPVIDFWRNSLYVTTGNNYTVPQSILDCVDQFTGSSVNLQSCIQAVPGSLENHFDAFVSLDLDNGEIKWATSVLPFDAWTAGCFVPDSPNCPSPPGPDYDFGQGPMLFSVDVDGCWWYRRDLLGAGQKSGHYWALDPDGGEIVWSIQVGPGGELGGHMWGSTVMEGRIFTAIANTNFEPWELTGTGQSGQVVKGGFWSALDASSGNILWQTAINKPPHVPDPPIFETPPPADAVAYNLGALASANGVVFAGAMDPAGTMVAMDAQSGEILWSFESGGSVNSGPAVVNGVVYWGSGYRNLDLGTGNNRLYAFEITLNQ